MLEIHKKWIWHDTFWTAQEPDDQRPEILTKSGQEKRQKQNACFICWNFGKVMINDLMAEPYTYMQGLLTIGTDET